MAAGQRIDAQEGRGVPGLWRGPAQQRGQGVGMIEQTVAIGRKDLAIGTLRAIAVFAVVQAHGGLFERRAVAQALMDFIADKRWCVRQAQMPADLAQLLDFAQGRGQIEHAESGHAACFALQAQRIVQRLAQHLHATAQTDQFAAVTQMALQIILPAVGAQPSQIGAHRLGAGQYHHVGWRRRLRGRDEPKIDLGMQAQGIEIVVIGEPGIGRRDDREARCAGFENAAGARILGVEIEAVQVG